MKKVFDYFLFAIGGVMLLMAVAGPWFVEEKSCPPCPETRDTVIVKDTVVIYKTKKEATGIRGGVITH